MRNIENNLCEEYPTFWVTYVDLKQHISEFKRHKNAIIEFSSFVIEKILNLNIDSFEAQLFKKLYKNDKLLILFDGFDEIAPNCADIVIKLARSFKFNGGNQLWIATRDYFGLDLQNKLDICDVYKLDEFTQHDGTSLIIKSWLLTDVEVNMTDNIESHPDYTKYHQRAYRIINKVMSTNNRSIGMPQIFKMIADGFKNNENAELGLQLLSMFRCFVRILYERWSHEKGSIRKAAGSQSQEYEYNFWRFHQYHAVASKFPKLVKIYFKNFNGRDWPDVEVIACGLMSKKDKKFQFLHDTFKEFFAADFIAKNLRCIDAEVGVKKEEFYIIKLVCKILTNQEYGTIRIFMNDIIEDTELMDKVMPELKKRTKKLYEDENLIEIFSKNLNNIAEFVLNELKAESYDVKKEVLFKSAKNIVSKLRDD
ncbi:hypothetical protein ACKWTF_015420 [Chironomus riparius]